MHSSAQLARLQRPSSILLKYRLFNFHSHAKSAPQELKYIAQTASCGSAERFLHSSAQLARLQRLSSKLLEYRLFNFHSHVKSAPQKMKYIAQTSSCGSAERFSHSSAQLARLQRLSSKLLEYRLFNFHSHAKSVPQELKCIAQTASCGSAERFLHSSAQLARLQRLSSKLLAFCLFNFHSHAKSVPQKMKYITQTSSCGSAERFLHSSAQLARLQRLSSKLLEYRLFNFNSHVKSAPQQMKCIAQPSSCGSAERFLHSNAQMARLQRLSSKLLAFCLFNFHSHAKSAPQKMKYIAQTSSCGSAERFLHSNAQLARLQRLSSKMLEYRLFNFHSHAKSVPQKLKYIAQTSSCGSAERFLHSSAQLARLQRPSSKLLEYRLFNFHSHVKKGTTKNEIYSANILMRVC